MSFKNFQYLAPVGYPASGILKSLGTGRESAAGAGAHLSPQRRKTHSPTCPTVKKELIEREETEVMRLIELPPVENETSRA